MEGTKVPRYKTYGWDESSCRGFFWDLGNFYSIIADQMISNHYALPFLR